MNAPRENANSPNEAEHLLATGLSSGALLWVYGFDRALRSPEIAILESSLGAFTERWQSHGEPVKAAWMVVDSQFVVLAGEVPGGNISGCGIDASVRIFREFKDSHGLDAMNRHLVFYRDGDSVKAVSRGDFKKLVDAGDVDGCTLVYDQTLATLGELQAKGLVRPVRDSWHGKAFRLS